MNCKRLIAAGLLVFTALVLGCVSPHGSGWTTLLDGSDPKTLENWYAAGEPANWRIVDGALQADKGGKATSHFVTKNSYRDFQIRAEFWADATTNSGILIRIQDPKKISVTTSYEVNIYDQSPNAGYGTGSIVNVAKVDPMPKAGGKWNTLLITAKDDNLVVVLNGEETVNIRHAAFANGPFSLQYGTTAEGAPRGPIKWRKVEIRPL